jgi:hypothetical protein
MTTAKAKNDQGPLYLLISCLILFTSHGLNWTANGTGPAFTFTNRASVPLVPHLCLNPKKLLSLRGTIGSLGSVTWSHFFYKKFETFCKHAPWNKLRGSTNFIIFGLTNQKLWGNENFRRNLGKAGKYCSPTARVNHMCNKMWIGGKRGILQGESYRHPLRKSK